MIKFKGRNFFKDELKKCLDFMEELDNNEYLTKKGKRKLHNFAEGLKRNAINFMVRNDIQFSKENKNGKNT